MEILHAFSKAIRTSAVEHQTISDFGLIGKISEIIGKLESLPGAEHLMLSDLTLRPNVKDWIVSLISDHQENLNIDTVKYLLNDFTGGMKTRSREDSKNVIGILYSKRLIICHSACGSETITPAWEIITRMLDTDNVIRYVSFEAHEHFTKVYFWEKYASGFLVDWLGLSRKQGYAFGGAFRFKTELQGMDLELQLDDDQVDLLLKEHPEFEQGKLFLDNPIHHLNIETVKIGGNQSLPIDEFIQLRNAEKFGVQPYRDKYENIACTISPVLNKYIDDEKEVIAVYDGKKHILVSKELPSIDLIFTNQYIEISPKYLNKLVTRLLNNEPLALFHVGCEMGDKPVKISGTEIYSRLLVDDLTDHLIRFYNSIKLDDHDLNCMLKYLIYSRLASSNSESPIVHLMTKFKDEILRSMHHQASKWIKPEDGLIEYKSGDYISGKQDEVEQRILDDLSTKLLKEPVKLYLFGLEDDGTVAPISKTRWPSDRIGQLTQTLKNHLTAKGVLSEISLSKIEYKNGYVIVMAVRKY